MKHLSPAFSIVTVYLVCTTDTLDFPCCSVVKNPPVNAGDVGLIPGSGRSPGKGNGNLLQYSCLGNSTDRSLADYSLWGHKESDTTEQSSMHEHAMHRYFR